MGTSHNGARLEGKELKGLKKMSFNEMVDKAETLLHEGQVEAALPVAQKALKERQPDVKAAPGLNALPALNILAEIHLELGDPDEARQCFEAAVAVDPDGTVSFDKGSGGGVEKFFYLAQLSEEGGQQSLEWLMRGCAILRREVAKHNSSNVTVLEGDDFLQELQEKLAKALCAMVEIYMTDLSFEQDAEEHAETLISEALPLWEASESNDPTVLQTLASIRISQLRLREAKEALQASLDLWNNESLSEEADTPTPDFATRISVSRLLMEAGMETNAMRVIKRLVAEDDHSVEAWYLGGWCLYLLGQEPQALGVEVEDEAHKFSPEEKEASLRASRKWLEQSLQLYELLDYEDDRLKQHALELIGELDSRLPEGDGKEDEEIFEGFEPDENLGHDDVDEEMRDG